MIQSDSLWKLLDNIHPFLSYYAYLGVMMSCESLRNVSLVNAFLFSTAQKNMLFINITW